MTGITLMTGVTLEDLKNYLNITYDLDTALESKLTGILNRGNAVLQSTASTVPEGTGDEQQLLLDCCRYIWNDAYEDFKVNFADELFMLRAKYTLPEATAGGEVDNGG